MSDVYRILLGFHVLVATVALGTFWGAMLARKGGTLHLRCGLGFAVSMGATAATAALLCFLLLAQPLAVRPPGPEVAPAEIGAYVAFLRKIGGGLLEQSLVAGALLYFGVRALGRRRGSSRNGVDLGVAGCAVVAGLSLFVLGLDADRPYLEGIGILLSLVGGLQIRALLRTRPSKSAWLVQHLVGMMGAAAIAHGAFATNIAGLFTDDLSTAFGWGGLTFLAFAGFIGWTARRWRNRLERPGKPRFMFGAPNAVSLRTSRA